MAEINRKKYSRKNFEFSRFDYQEMLRELVDLGYKDVRGLDEIIPKERYMFIRHDVDMCLDRAARIAEIEAEVGVVSTYYLLVSTPIYSVASARAIRQVNRILDCGHAIGLHFDASQYDQTDREALEVNAQRECKVLETLFDTEVTSISFHRPATSLMGLDGNFAGRPHSYQTKFFEDIGYISDSSGGFYQGHPLDHPAVLEGRAIQLLTHPIWWFEECATSAEVAIDRLRQEQHTSIEYVLNAATAKAKTRAANSRQRN